MSIGDSLGVNWKRKMVGGTVMTVCQRAIGPSRTLVNNYLHHRPARGHEGVDLTTGSVKEGEPPRAIKKMRAAPTHREMGQADTNV